MCINILKPKITSLSIILFIIFGSVCFSQSDFRNGYYITWENDTIEGLLDYRADFLNSKQCTYRKDEFSKSTKFSPEDIQSYRYIDSKYYISKKINTSKGEEQVFVEFLLDGITNLYFYNDFEDYFYIIESKAGELFELKKETKTKFVEGKGEVIEETFRYIGILKWLFGDCKEIQPLVDQVKLDHKSLIKLNKKYHDYVCFDEKCIIYEKNPRKIKIQFGPIAGIAISNLSFNRGFYSNFTYDPSINISYGIQANIFPPLLNEKISIQLEVLCNKNDLYGIYKDYYELFINNSMLHSSVGIKYNYLKGAIGPSIALGASHNLLLNPEIYALVENVPGQPATEVPLSTDDIILTPNLWGGFIQLGCNYRFIKNLDLFSNIKYTHCTGRTKTVFSGTPTFVITTINTINFSFGFFF